MIRAASMTAALCVTAGLTTSAFAVNPKILCSDNTLDRIMVLQDLDNDGFASASVAGEIKVFFDGTNASGVPGPTNTFCIVQFLNGDVFIGDGDTDSVYRLRDLNHDGDANDVGEAVLYYTGGAAGPLIQTPNGISLGPGHDVYVLSAGASPSTLDVMVHCHDTDGDSRCTSAGEGTLYADLSLVANSTPFNLTFAGDVAYFSDLRGAQSDVIFRAEDSDHNGVIDIATELVIYNDAAAGFGPVGFPVRGLDTTVYGMDSTSTVANQRMVAYGDTNNSHSIDSASEARTVWQESQLSALPGLTLGTIFDFDIRMINGRLEAYVASSGADSADNVFHLVDLNGDGDFLDAGETQSFCTANSTAFPEAIRAICILKTCLADFNGDGSVDFFDYLDFIDAFSANSWVADFNQDDALDFFDYLDFVDLFSVGC